jgi:transaldolase
MAETNGGRMHALHQHGQSVWLDFIRRGIIGSGELAKMIEDHDLRGVTSNPSIFEQAIGKGDDYDASFQELAASGSDAVKAFDAVALDDIRDAADLFRPVFDRAEGHDGFISMEVSPTLADDTDATLEEARRLWKALDRPNVMIKVPGTDAGIPAIEQLVSEGMNVNITLLFSLRNYEQVMEAYLRGLERRAEAGQPLGHVASVASFFVSRVDNSVDAKLEEIIRSPADEGTRAKARGLLGKAAIANAKLAYERFQQVFSGERWEKLAAKGAHVQRPLWASTSTKNPAYRDVLYVEELIGPHTVNTMPLATIEAFADHGVATRTVDADVDVAKAQLASLAELGIDLDEVTRELQIDGVKKFAKSFEDMMAVVGQKLERVAAAR